MQKIYSNTLVKNGMPFIGKVLEQVQPYIQKCVITISNKSNDGTIQTIESLAKKYPEKFDIEFENMGTVAELTFSRQEMIYRSKDADWIMFLDDDDYWDYKSLGKAVEYVNHIREADGFAFNPYQVVDKSHYNDSWRNKWFTKLFRNIDINYRGLFPRDLIYTANTSLYWRDNLNVIRLPIRFFHLSDIKNHSFRTEKWATEFAQGLPQEATKFGNNEKEILNAIFE